MGRIINAAGMHFETHVPVLVVGAGACGLVGALKAHDCGAEVLVLEQDGTPAGSTALSSGFIPAAGTRFQAAAGIDDNPNLFASDIERKAKGLAAAPLVELAAGNCGPVLEWLADSHGLEWVVIGDFLYPGHSRHRMHAVPERTGAALMARLLYAVEQAGIAIAAGALVTELYTDGATVRGVGVTRKDGNRETVGCDALLLACSGFGGNAGLVAQHIPEMTDALFFGHAGNRGDALEWAAELGGQLRDLSGYQGHGSVATPHGILISWALMMEGGIQVNAQGRRFANEHLGYSEQAVEVLRQPDGVAWNIYDERLHRLGMGFEDYRDAVVAGAIRNAADINGLSQVTGIPEDALADTIGTVALYRAGALADPFGRDFTGDIPLQPPFHAVRVTGAMFHTQGGAMIDGAARIVGPDGLPIGNICAGGGAACGVSGPHASGYLSGNGLLTAVTFGAIAGETCARLALETSASPAE